MARLLNGTSDYFSMGTPTALSVSAGTMFVWLYPGSSTAVQIFFNYRVDGSNEIEIGDLHGLSSLNVRFVYRGGGSSSTVNSAASLTASVWSNVAMTWDKTADQMKAYINGTQEGTTQTGLPTISGTPTGLRWGNSPFTDYFQGRMAEAALWDVALGQNEITALARGRLPCDVRPMSLIEYSPLWGLDSPEPDQKPSGGTRYALTISGTPSLANGPPVVPFSRRWPASAPLIETAAGFDASLFPYVAPHHHHNRPGRVLAY